MELHFNVWPQSDNNSRAGSKIMFLHGLGGTGNIWRPIAAELESRYTVIAPDQRGHGKSIDPNWVLENLGIEEFSPSRFALDLFETIEKNQLHPVSLVGHSMGVRTACHLVKLVIEERMLEFALPHNPNPQSLGRLRQYVRNLVLIDLNIGTSSNGGGFGAQLGIFLSNLPEKFSTRSEMQNFLFQNAPDKSLAQYLLAVALKKNNDWVFPFLKRAILLTLEGLNHQLSNTKSIVEILLKIAKSGLPVLILRGEKSPVYPSEDFQRDRVFFQNYPNLHFQEVRKAGHGLPFENKTEFLSLLKTFIENGVQGGMAG